MNGGVEGGEEPHPPNLKRKSHKQKDSEIGNIFLPFYTEIVKIIS